MKWDIIPAAWGFRFDWDEPGRRTQVDPIGIAGGINLYQFNGNDPASYDDPYGLCPPLDANDGQHCYTAGATQLSAGQLRSVAESSAQRPSEKDLTLSASATLGNTTLVLSGSGLDIAASIGPPSTAPALIST